MSRQSKHVHNFIIACDESGELAGSAEITMKMYPCKRNSRPDDQLPYICNVVVRKEYRKKGFGEALVLACEEKALEAGLDEIFLDTNSDNVAALSLYHKLGYVAEVVDPHYRSPRKVYMRKRLKETAPELKPDALSMHRIIRKDVEEGGGDADVVCVPVLNDDEIYLPPSSKLELMLGPFAPVATAVLAAFAWLLF
ncbi:hypothetical protein GUITHDRAFT_114355 [Guillardia theta CCMP2712]|uniref:N-acetyltransferase domain-containing protein n=2 Tax=Guillardia theta TaxID=55529 RepID=L1IU33_GUITC|nr:hypothetical protein GUITHDRAFT_114355 [Guillardia theta CCMP2712]EKX39627.1 hypothetical protein GUITHDRAFT_114355 [Guillardia theta CCMP2712]|eukprot:XP_005826607.1 hypothetical protein GUITHDRAFT_114355 [Guillardia theta CCMP2712]